VKEPPQIVVAQLGSRRGYAVPVLLHRAGTLAHFYTDAYAGKGWPAAALACVPRSLRSHPLRRLAGRRCEVPNGKITAFNLLGVEYVRRLQRARGSSERVAVHLWMGRAFAKRVAKWLDGRAAGVYALPSASLEIFQRAKEAGMKCILDQCAAAHEVEAEIMHEEHTRWPGWEDNRHVGATHDQMAGRLAVERDLADVVLCPSSFVRDSLRGRVPEHARVCVVPYGKDVARYACPARRHFRKGSLRVLFVGSVGLRKGAQYLLQAARALGPAVTVRLVGPVHCDEQKLRAAAPANVQIVGQVPHAEILEHYRWADVFCLPSLYEGSAGVTYEALAAGLPVICTPNTGSVVRDGVDGFIVPIRDVEAIAERIERLARDRELLAEMSRRAPERAQEYSWERYGERLVAAVSESLWEG